MIESLRPRESATVCPEVRTALLHASRFTAAGWGRVESAILYLAVCTVWGLVMFLALTQAGA